MSDGTITVRMADKYAALLAERNDLKAENERLDAGWQKLHGHAETIMLEDKTTIERLKMKINQLEQK